jgi:snoRNA binding domain, fibrillarin
MRVREWYGWHFPEMTKIVGDNILYAKSVRVRVRSWCKCGSGQGVRYAVQCGAQVLFRSSLLRAACGSTSFCHADQGNGHA